MKRIITVINLALAIVLTGVVGCSSMHKSESTPPPKATPLQGKWKGEEIGGSTQGPCYLTISGQTLEFRGADSSEWYKGTFTLREDTKPAQFIGKIDDCPYPQVIGASVYAIYEIKDGTLKLAGNEPGAPTAPVSFDAAGARQFVFKKE